MYILDFNFLIANNRQCHQDLELSPHRVSLYFPRSGLATVVYLMIRKDDYFLNFQSQVYSMCEVEMAWLCFSQ